MSTKQEKCSAFKIRMWTHTLPINRARCIAPATVHNDVSSLIFVNTKKKGASIPLKNASIALSQTSQHTRITRDFEPLHGLPCVSANADHHLWTEAVCFQFVGCSDGSTAQPEISAQIRPVNPHLEKRRIPVSETLRQRTQAGLCVQPLARRLSADSILNR
jgi:hypothetical protein